jgi:16S rRNA (guanine966-N2)-methyltransferase
MRIISGHARRIHLLAPPGQAVRPTTDRVKETLFSILGPLAGCRVADLFAGSGALGLEALSRGAGFVLFAERLPRHLECLNRNLAAVTRAMGTALPPDAVQVAPYDVRQLPRRLPLLQGSLDLVLADPPYHAGPGELGPAAFLQEPALAAWIGARAELVLEHDARTPLPWAPLGPWQLVRQRAFGHTVVSFARLVPEPSAPPPGPTP